MSAVTAASDDEMQDEVQTLATKLAAMQSIDFDDVFMKSAAELRRQHAEIERLRQQLAQPIDMVLHCPACGMQHVDEAEEERTVQIFHGPNVVDEVTVGWDNPPHRSHLCHGCSHIWRPADVPTNGVLAVKTKGRDDSPVVQLAQRVQPVQPVQHEIIKIAAECARREPIAAMHGLAEATHIGHRQFSRALDLTDAAILRVSARLKAIADSLSAAPAQPEQPAKIPRHGFCDHPDDEAAERFCAAMKHKLGLARANGRGGWQECSPDNLSLMLREHVEKGDPVDVANFCMFLWSLRDWIRPVAPTEQPASPFAIPALNHIARRKLQDLLADGHQVAGVMIERNNADGTVTRGAVGAGGLVIWWPPQNNPLAEIAVLASLLSKTTEVCRNVLESEDFEDGGAELRALVQAADRAVRHITQGKAVAA